MSLTDNKLRRINLKPLSRNIIRQKIKDLISDEYELIVDAHDYIDGDLFLLHMRCAEYPDELRDTLSDLVLRSKAAQKILGREILDLLKTNWDTEQRKTPVLDGGPTLT